MCDVWLARPAILARSTFWEDNSLRSTGMRRTDWHLFDPRVEHPCMAMYGLADFNPDDQDAAESAPVAVAADYRPSLFRIRFLYWGPPVFLQYWRRSFNCAHTMKLDTCRAPEGLDPVPNLRHVCLGDEVPLPARSGPRDTHRRPGRAIWRRGRSPGLVCAGTAAAPRNRDPGRIEQSFRSRQLIIKAPIMHACNALSMPAFLC